MAQDDDLMRLLETIAENEPMRRVPELPDVSRERRSELMRDAWQIGWLTVSSFRRDGTLKPGDILRLTADGHAALKGALGAQDDDADDKGINPAERQRRRSQFMKALYDEVGDNTGRVVEKADIGCRLGWEDAETKPVVRYLASRGLVAYRAFGRIAITQAGVDEVELAVSEPAKPTQHLASMNLTFGDVNAPVQLVQAGRADLTQAVAGDHPPAKPSIVARLRSWTGAILLGAIGSLVAACVIWLLTRSDGTERTALLTIDNRVTNGPSEMREDVPLRLVREPALSCFDRPSCVVDEPQCGSGDRLTARCRTEGDRVTNGADRDSTDDVNPALYESTLWYGVRRGDESLYVSEVWVDRHARDGMGLPQC